MLQVHTPDRAGLEVLWQLFRNGPTWDGNIVSKQARDRLIKANLAIREQGWTTLTSEGFRLAITAEFHERKGTQ